MRNLHDRNERVHGLLSDFGLDTKTVQTVSKSINDIEMFMAVNCGITTFHDVKRSDPRSKDERSETFLRDIRPLNFESLDDNRCSLDRMLSRSEWF